MEQFLDNLSNYKKKYILFCDEHDNAENQRIKMKIWWKTTLRVDGIVKFKDDQIILEKDRIGYKLNQLKEMVKHEQSIMDIDSVDPFKEVKEKGQRITKKNG